jgi:hypothetical protein
MNLVVVCYIIVKFSTKKTNTSLKLGTYKCLRGTEGMICFLELRIVVELCGEETLSC